MRKVNTLPRLVFISLFIIGALHVSAQRKEGLPMISTHRGASHLAPENTLAAFSKAIELNADFIEIDVRTTADGVQVIVHDGSLKRTTGLNARVETITLEEIKKLSAGSWFDKKYVDEKVPTLTEVCELVAKENRWRKNQVKLYVDCKAINAEQVIQTLKKYSLLDSAVFYGDINTLTEIKKQHVSARLMPAFPGKEQLDQLIDKIAPYAVDVAYDELNPEIVSLCHAKGISVFSDLLGKNDGPPQYRKAMQLKIDLIQTDNITSVLQEFKNVELKQK